MLPIPSLNDPTGPYPVGATTFVRSIPKADQVTIGSGRVHPRDGSGVNSDGTRPALLLEEVAFTAFYPADIHAPTSWRDRLFAHDQFKKGVSWMVEPIDETLKGYEHWLGDDWPGGAGSKVAAMVRYGLSWWASNVKMQVYGNAPMLPPTSSSPDGWPLVVFSHGLVGTRNTYSTLCAHLASQGRIVVAMEHRDGTGPVVFPHERVMQYIVPDEVLRPGEKWQGSFKRGAYNSESSLQFRFEQLEFRRREIYETIRSIHSLSISGQVHTGLKVIDDHEHDFSRWHSSVNIKQVDLAGHSFGGATLLSLLANPPSPIFNSQEQYPRIPVRQTLLLDPWMEPFSGVGPKPYTTDSEKGNPSPPSDLQLLVINSEYFSLWESHFADAQRAVATFPSSRIITLLRSDHMVFSDVWMFAPRRFQPADGPKLLDTICRVSDQFLNRGLSMSGDLGASSLFVRDALMETVMDEAKEKGKRKFIGEEGDIVVHA